jgi:hypothetical protein
MFFVVMYSNFSFNFRIKLKDTFQSFHTLCEWFRSFIPVITLLIYHLCVRDSGVCSLGRLLGIYMQYI